MCTKVLQNSRVVYNFKILIDFTMWLISMLTSLINAVHVLKRNPVITDYFRKVKHVPLIDSLQEVITKTKACDSGWWCSTTDRWTVNAERCTARRRVGYKATRRDGWWTVDGQQWYWLTFTRQTVRLIVPCSGTRRQLTVSCVKVAGIRTFE